MFREKGFWLLFAKSWFTEIRKRRLIKFVKINDRAVEFDSQAEDWARSFQINHRHSKITVWRRKWKHPLPAPDGAYGWKTRNGGRTWKESKQNRVSKLFKVLQLIALVVQATYGLTCDKVQAIVRK